MPNRPMPLRRRTLSLALAGVLLAPTRAFAHAILLESQPAADGKLAAGTVTLRFRYNSRIDRARSRLVLTRPDHSQTTLKIAPDGPPDVVSATAELTPGPHMVRWQVLAVDGHITRGDVSFTVTGT